MKSLLRLILVISVTITATNPIQATGYQGVKPFNLQQFFDEVIAKPGADVSQEPGIFRVEVPCDHAIYFFTTAEHPAYPSVVIRQVVVDGDGVFIKTQGYTAGDKALFEQWLTQFEQQNFSIQ